MENYFAFYDLPVSIKVDQEELRRKYLAVSRATHPDYHRFSSPEMQAEAEKRASLNNKAYAILKDDYTRLTHWFQVKGLLSETGENLTDVQLSAAFLGEMMDYNERIEQASYANNPAEREQLLTELQPMIRQKEADLFQTAAFSEAKDPETQKKALKLYLEHKYLLRIRENLRNIAT
jgi:molecular chaperone HscB